MYDIVDNEKDNPVGFGVYTYNRKKKVVKGVLGGIYPQYKAIGYGCAIVDSPIKLGIARGAKVIEVVISSNNDMVYKLYDRFNFHMTSAMYVLRKMPSDTPTALTS